jgi:hypothetical protein
MKPIELPSPRFARGWGLLALAAGLLLVGMTGLSAWHTFRHRDALLKAADEAVLRGAQLAFEQSLERERQQALRVAELLVDDTRVRATVLAPRFDEATVRDVLQDLRAAGQASVLAVLDGAGKVRVENGLPELGGMDLSAAAAVRNAPLERSTDVWTIGQRVFAVAVAQIRSGPSTPALLLTGIEIDAAALRPIERAHGVRGALAVGQKIVVRTAGPGDAALDPVFRTAATRGEGSGRVGEGAAAFVYRVSETGPGATSARALWVVGGRHLLASAAPIGGIWWLPVLLAGLMWLLVVALVRL